VVRITIIAGAGIKHDITYTVDTTLIQNFDFGVIHCRLYPGPQLVVFLAVVMVAWEYQHRTGTLVKRFTYGVDERGRWIMAIKEITSYNYIVTVFITCNLDNII